MLHKLFRLGGEEIINRIGILNNMIVRIGITIKIPMKTDNAHPIISRSTSSLNDLSSLKRCNMDLSKIMLISDVNHDEKNSIVEAEEKKVSSLRNCLKKASRKNSQH